MESWGDLVEQSKDVFELYLFYMETHYPFNHVNDDFLVIK
jgi:hypothetical protein